MVNILSNFTYKQASEILFSNGSDHAEYCFLGCDDALQWAGTNSLEKHWFMFIFKYSFCK